MKARYLRREKGQGCIEFLIALAIIIILILAVIWIISGLIVLIRENLIVIQSTPPPTTIPAETVVPTEFINTPSVTTPGVLPTEKTDGTSVDNIAESTTTPSQSAAPEKTFWENISDWIYGR